MNWRNPFIRMYQKVQYKKQCTEHDLFKVCIRVSLSVVNLESYHRNLLGPIATNEDTHFCRTNRFIFSVIIMKKETGTQSRHIRSTVPTDVTLIV